MTESLRPKIYLVLCLIALALEGTYILLSAPSLCIKCKKTFADARSTEFPNELCKTCVEEIREKLVPGFDSTPYDPPYPVDPEDPVVVLDTTRGRVEVE